MSRGNALVDGDWLEEQLHEPFFAAAIGCLAVAAGLMIHKESPPTWFLLLGLLPGVIGAWFTYAWCEQTIERGDPGRWFGEGPRQHRRPDAA